jgi:CO/xanthine dehydrogenase FAD-binding subunit
MLAFDFDYYLPDTLEEAIDIFDSTQKEGKTPLYYGGGTEIISMARVFNIQPDVVIDIKRIPECGEMGSDGTKLVFGSALTLNTIHEGALFPLLGVAGGRVADHTIQCKLTLGGNLAGTIRYHETLLPLLLADSMIDIISPQGRRQAPIIDVLSSGKRLVPGELIIKVMLDQKFAAHPYAHIKKTKTEKIGYPLVSLSAIYVQGILRLATSGLCDQPFRFPDIPIGSGYCPNDVAQQLASSIPAPILDDIEGSAAYRKFIFEKSVEDIIVDYRKERVNTIA